MSAINLTRLNQFAIEHSDTSQVAVDVLNRLHSQISVAENVVTLRQPSKAIA